MNKKELIDSLFAILCLYEDIFKTDKPTTEEDYVTYLGRKYITFLGRGNTEIAYILEGLKKVKLKITHDELRTMVFHMIGLIEKEGIEC